MHRDFEGFPIFSNVCRIWSQGRLGGIYVDSAEMNAAPWDVFLVRFFAVSDMTKQVGWIWMHRDFKDIRRSPATS